MIDEAQSLIPDSEIQRRQPVKPKSSVDVRSKRCIFVSHCMLAQGIMANGVVRIFPAIVKPVIQFCLDHDINIMQMPCPETLCMSGGLGREPHGKKWYEAHGLRETSRTIAEGQAKYMTELVGHGYTILAVVGVDFSPACAVNYLNKGRSIHRDTGIYVEELKRCLAARGLDILFIGISQRWHKKMVEELEALLT